MDQNSETLNKAINETLKKVDRNRRMRGLTGLTFALLLCLFSYAPAIFKALNNTPVQYSWIIAYLCIASTVYGVLLIVFGRKVRIYYLKYFGPGRAARVIFYLLFAGLIFFLDMLVRTMLALLARQ